MHVDLEFVHAIAADLKGLHAMRDLLRGVAARAVHVKPEEAQRIMASIASVLAQLDENDSISAVVRLAAASA